MEENNIVEWNPSSMLEVTLNEPDDILHKQGRYFIVHFKELFLLDGKKSNLEENDVARRNTIATLMSDWGLLTVDNTSNLKPIAPLRQIKIISYKDKGQWELCPKYNIGNGIKN